MIAFDALGIAVTNANMPAVRLLANTLLQRGAVFAAQGDIKQAIQDYRSILEYRDYVKKDATLSSTIGHTLAPLANLAEQQMAPLTRTGGDNTIPESEHHE